MNSVEHAISAFGEAAVTALQSLSVAYSDLQNRAGGFGRFSYLTNAEYIPQYLPDILIARYGIEELLKSKRAHDFQNWLLLKPDVETQVDFMDVENEILAMNLRGQMPVDRPKAPVRLTTMHKDLTSVLEDAFSSFSDVQVHDQRHQGSRVQTFSRPLKRGVTWEISVIEDAKESTLCLNNGIIGLDDRRLGVDLDRLANMPRLFGQSQLAEMENYLGLSLHLQQYLSGPEAK